jgi:hypothetical protein
MIAVFETREETRLAESIAVEKFCVRQKFSGAPDKFGRHGRAAISQNLEAAQVIRLRLGHLRQEVQHRRHEHRVYQRRALRVIPECPAERMKVNHGVLFNEGVPGAARLQASH